MREKFPFRPMAQVASRTAFAPARRGRARFFLSRLPRDCGVSLRGTFFMKSSAPTPRNSSASSRAVNGREKKVILCVRLAGGLASREIEALVPGETEGIAPQGGRGWLGLGLATARYSRTRRM